VVRETRNAYVTPELVVNAYHQGFFPMSNENGDIGFYAYEPRGILPLDDRFRVRRSLQQIYRRHDFEIRFDTAVRDVLTACSRHGQVPAYDLWLSGELIDIYMELFARGIVHTVEVWKADDAGHDELIGGLYGLSFGGAFCGESMFSREPFASQLALIALVERLRGSRFELLDAQMPSDHLKQFGLFECTQQEYLDLFVQSSRLDRQF
jgi:leucyl/phenylalanyl-tRNA--protein transferase